MGNFLGLAKKDDLTLDFSGLRTENISTTIPYMNRLNNDARSLVERLNTKNYVPAQNQVFTETENYDMYKLFEKTQDLNDNTFSDTSPFISSDVYKNLVDKQTGGGKKHRGEEKDSSSSSNSSSSSSNGSESESETPKKSKKESKDSDMSGGNDDSYVSSSAHTEGISSASLSGVSSMVSSMVSSKVSSAKTSSRKHRGPVLPDSINTSDINMISVEE
jgi:hypothetical protein